MSTRSAQEEDRHLYEELSRLNNELSTLQRELYKKNLELEKLNEQKNTFLGIVSHDLRNPLSLVMGYADFLKEDLGDQLDAERLECLNQIGTSSQYMAKLVNDLLDITMIESGKLRLDLTAFDIVELVKECVSLNNPIAVKKEIELSTKAPIGPIRFVADRVKLAQVLNNLLSNALKFSPRGSVVSISLAEAPERIEISIADEGPGIEEEELARIFKPFMRGAARPTEGEESTGLGLAIVKKIIEGHGGLLNVERLKPRGSKFLFALPSSSH